MASPCHPDLADECWVSSAFGYLCFDSLTAVKLAAAAQVPILPLCALSSAPPCHTYPHTAVLPLGLFYPVLVHEGRVRTT